MATNTHTPTDEAIWDDLGARYGRAWEASNDYADRVVPVEDAYADAPRVERIRPRVAATPHLPGSHWEATSCLCSCHYGARTSAGAPACDERECVAWGKQNAERKAREDESKARAKARRLARKVKSA